jgi:hypothetical protein
MRKISFLLSALILGSSFPLYAAYCSNCGKNLPKEANFCSNCGKAAAGVFQAVEPEKASSPSITDAYSSIPVIKSDIEALEDYHFINRIEEYLTLSTSNVALRHCQELKRQNAEKMQIMERDYMNYSIYRRKMHDLHMGKLQAMENYLDARIDVDKGVDVARAKAYMDKELFIIDKINEALDMLISGGNTLSNINKVENFEKRIKKTTANYVVTSSYLTLGNVRVKRDEPIWIEDVSGASARVHHMGQSLGDEPVVGNVSIYDLEKRSNWTSDSDFFYSTPTGSTVVLTQTVKTEPNINVVVWDDVYPYRRWRHHPYWRETPPPPPPPYHPPVVKRPAPHPPAPGRPDHR